VHQSVLRIWLKGFESDPQHSYPGHTQMKPEQLEIARLKREVSKLKAEQDILKKSRGLLRERSDVKFAFIVKYRGIWPAGWWCGHNPHTRRAEIRRPLQRLLQRRAIGRRGPFDQDQHGGELVAAALGDEAVHKMLRPALQITAVIVIARDRDDAKMGMRFGASWNIPVAEHLTG